MRIAFDPGPREGPGRLQRLHDDGTPLAEPEVVADLSQIAAVERDHDPRWVFARSRTHRRLLAAGVEVARAHDVELVEGLIVGADGRFGEPHGLAAAAARLAGRNPDPDPPHLEDGPPALFETGPTEELAEIVAVHAAQQRRLADDRKLRFLAAAESAAGLVAAEMATHGLPWRPDLHNALLTELLGPRPTHGGRPPKLQALADQVVAAFGGRPMNPDSPADVLRAFARAGHDLETTRSWVIRDIDHPAVEPLLAYKELSRLFTANGWSWLRTWVHPIGEGRSRFSPEYVVGGVVTGRWASRGGGALQIPRPVRAAVRADPGWRLIAADAAQLEPRVLAAMSQDHALAPDVDDHYTALASRDFDGDRATAKLALISAMYGQTTGGAGQLLGTLRRRFPAAMGLLEDAARAGEEGRLVRSLLGRTCPPARPGQEELSRARARGRFTRNFVVQATAAEWALVLLAEIRLALRAAASPAHLVFFQHDEVLLHSPAEHAEEVADIVRAAAVTAGRRLFGDSPVRFPMQPKIVEGYDEK